MKKPLALVASVVLATAAAACSSSSNKSADSAGTSSSASSSGVSSTGATANTLSYSTRNSFAAQVKRDGQSVLIGVMNDEKGSFSDPQQRAAIETAFKQINAHGGINGAQVKEDLCLTDGTPDSAINCANKFVGDKAAMVTSGLAIAADAAVPILTGAKIPWVSDIAYSSTPSSYVWEMGNDLSVYSVYSVQAAKVIGSKKMGYVATADPVHEHQGKQIKAVGPITGTSPVIGPYQSSSNPDWSTAVQTVQTQGADGLFIDVTENNCTSIVTDAIQLGFKAPILSTCSDYLKTVPQSKTSDTYYLSPTFQPASAAYAPPQIKANIDDYVTQMTANGYAKYIYTAALDNYASTENIATLLRTISDAQITPASVQAALQQNHNLPAFAGPDFNCGGKVWPAQPQACSGWLLAAKNEFQNGKLVQVPIQKANFGFIADPQLAAKSTQLP